jgi:hypothetical protein
MIDSAEESVVVPRDEECREVLRKLRGGEGVPRLMRRKLQRHSVSVRPAAMAKMRGMGAAVETAEGSGIFVLADLYAAMYHPRFGLLDPEQVVLGPESLIK